MSNDNPNITVDDVKKLAPDLLQDATDDTVNALIKSATVFTLADGFPQPVGGVWNAITIEAIKYLTLHMSTMDDSAGQGITSEQVSVIKTTYESKIGKDWLHSSVWGLLYYRLWKLYGGGASRYAVVQH